MIPGIRRRLLEELKYSVENVDKYKGLSGLKDLFKIEKPIYPANVLTWIGGSLLSCLNEEIDTFLVSKREFVDEEKWKLPDRFGHCFLTCSRKTEIESSDEEKDQKDDYLDDKFKIPETKRPLNYFNKKFEEINNMRKELLYRSATPYSTRRMGRTKEFVFPK